MTREEKYKMLWTKIKGYQHGTLESKIYTEKQLKEKRQYFENCEPPTHFGVSKKRWQYEIKRIFDLSDNFKKCPDLGLTRLEYILEFGL